MSVKQLFRLNAFKNSSAMTKPILNAMHNQTRCLHLHEYQSMTLMQKYGVHLPNFTQAGNPVEAETGARNLANKLGSKTNPIDFVVKAQVLSGGRGLGYFKETGFKGGVQVCTSPTEVKDIASKMIGSTLITKQTGEEGKICNKVLIAERFNIRREIYFAILMDRSSGGPLLLGSSVGGTSIEDIAARHPDCIVKHPISLSAGLSDSDIKEFVIKLGFKNEQIKDAANSVKGLYQMFIEKDCLLVEVNPFAETNDGRVLVCDAKVSFDDNASFRQKDIFALQDITQEDPREVTAAQFDLNYIGLDGTVGCMVNGAGLAMATMDILQLHGGKPANFLDVGGGANDTQVMEALKILENDLKVNSIFINIFGGIMRCDTIALGLIHASTMVGLTKPMVVRLEGTKKNEAKQLLEESGMKLIFESDFSIAAKKAVSMAEIVAIARKACLEVSFTS